MALRCGWARRAAQLVVLLLAAALLIAPAPHVAFAQEEADLTAQAGTTTYSDDQSANLDNPGTTYILQGSGSERHSGSHFTVPGNRSSEDNPIVIILDNVNRSQQGEDPDASFITIESGNYVIVKLRGNNVIKAGEHERTLGDEGMAGIHVSTDSTLKVTSEKGDGFTDGSLEVYGGGGGKYGGAGIGTRYNDNCGTVIIAGGTIRATGGHSAAGIGSGRDGVAYDVRVTGGNVYAQGGKYAAGIGSGDNVGTGEGGDLYNLSITGGTIEAHGGDNAAGIGCSEGAHLHGTLSIENATITAFGGENGAGIGGGESTDTIRVVIDQTQGSPLSIEAHGGKDAAGIGSGDEDCESVSITLRGGTVVAYGGENGAGIGGGDCVGSIDIAGTGKIRTYGGQNGCGIGGGNNSDVQDHLTIAGDFNGVGQWPLYIWAEAGPGKHEDNQAAAIGSGKGGCCDISISNAELVTSANHQGADIGGGSYHITPGGTVNNITIDNCNIRSLSKHKATACIGAGYGGSVKNININNTVYEGGGIGGSLMAFNYIGLNSVDSITITDSTIHAAWDEEKPGDTPGGISCNSPLDHGAAGIGSGLFGSMGSITIHDSTVYAKGFGSGAGIGGGGAGSNSKIFGLDKLDIGNVGTIEIRNSTVEAHSGCAYFTEGTPITVDTGYIIYTIEPASMGSGAGIGGGSGAGVQKIDIQDCPKVQAYSHSGAGIGGGRGSNMLVGGWVDHIYLINCDEVTAKGGKLCAGIGTGGGDGLRGPRSSALKEIYIKDCDKVTATGGESAAGIGCGIASPYEDADTLGGKAITIIDSNVTATGGKGGAGIGGGVEQAKTGYGGENPPILIKGNCRIDAKGGDCNYYEDYACDGGGAGIGGGSNGGATTIEIELTEDETTPRGYMGFPGDSHYYVHAEGGEGAAGIGGGGSAWTEGGLSKGSNDSDSIYIKSGAVFARGGATHYAAKTRDHDGGLHLGAGAGIGGGSAEGTVSLVKITGGYIQAEGGRYTNGSDKADDIGTGGDWSTESEGNRDASGMLVIEDGTVFANRVISFGGTKRISGGSVSAKIDGAINDSGSSVYQTTAKLENAGAKQVSLQTMRGYGANHLYTNGEGQLYLYLERRGSAEDKSQWADINVADDVRHYIGYTLEDHSGLLKMDGKEVPFNDPGIVRYGSDFELSLQDAKGYSGAQWTFVVEGVASSNDTGTVTTSPGAKLSLHAGALGALTVRGTSPYTPNADYYWGTKASFSGQVQGMDPQAAFTEDPAKVYDGTPVVNPSVTSASGGAVSYVYQDSQGVQLEGAPKDVGTYTVTATVAATGAYGEGVCSKQFKITPADTTTVLSFEVDGSAVTMTARVLGLYEPDGAVHLRMSGFGTYNYIPERDIEVVALADGGFGAVFEAPEVTSATYSIHANFNPSSLGNYRTSSTYESRTKDLANRVIQGETYRKVSYGTEPFKLNMSTDHPTEDNDDWFFEVKHDSWAEYKFDSAVSVDRKTGEVTVHHAGKAVIEVRLGNFRDKLYNDTKTYVTVEVEPAPLTVTSYAYSGSNTETPITNAHYGQLASVHSALKFEGLQNGDKPEDFTHGHGYLEVSNIPQELGAGEFTLSIKRNAETVEPVTVNGTTYEQFFFARDYEINLVEGKLQVEKATLAVEAAETHGKYGGREPSYGWQLSQKQTENGCDGLAPWDSADTVFTVEPTVTLDESKAGGSFASLPAGTYEDVLVPQGGEAANYGLVYLPGDLVVDGVDLGDTGRFEVRTQDVTYNGQSQLTVTVVDKDRDGATLVEGTDYTLTSSDNTTDVGEVTVTVTGTGGYSGTRVASYAIRKARVTVTTQSAIKPYDGTPLTADGSVEGIKEPDGYTFRTTGSQTEPGWSYNGYELTFANEQKSKNYNVIENLGKLAVRSSNVQDWSVSTPGDVTYDGEEHQADVTVVNELGQLLTKGTDYELSYEGSTKDAGIVKVTVTGAGSFTGTQEVSYQILPAPLRVRTNSASKEYDGQPLTAEGRIEGLVKVDAAELVITGTQTRVGNSVNTAHIEWGDATNASNYAVTEELGTLTVVAQQGEVIIEAPSVTKRYNGLPLVANGSDQEHPLVVTGLPDGHVVQATVVGSQTEVGSSPNVVVSYKILDAQSEDCTGAFANAQPMDGVLTVIQAPCTIEYLVSPTKVYDARQVDNPQVSYTGGGECSFAYYRFTGETPEDASNERLANAPTDAGRYIVEATVAETTNYTGATLRLPFVITQAPTAVHLKLQQEQGSASASATATIEGLYEEDYEEGGTVTFWVNGEQKGEPVPVKNGDGAMRATFEAYDVPEGHYNVKALFNPASGNYEASETTAAGDKDKATRTILGDTYLDKTYGDSQFDLKKELELSASNDSVNDTWRYEVVYDAYSTLGFDPAIEVSEDDKDKLAVCHAGTTIVEVTLSDGGSAYYDASVFVAIHVKPKDLTVRSLVLDDGGQTDLGDGDMTASSEGSLLAAAEDGQGTSIEGGQVTTAPYGTLDSLTYDVEPNPDDLVGDERVSKDITHGHGKLVAVPPSKMSGVRKDPYPIGIKKVGAPLTIGNTTYNSVFYARDYNIHYQLGSVQVVPADISDTDRFTAIVNNATYNGKEQLQPVYVTDASLGGALLVASKDYTLSYAGDPDSTNVGTVTVTAQGQGNYAETLDVDYKIDQAPLKVTTLSDSKLYDGKPLTAGGTLEGLVNNETVPFTVTGSQTEVGSSPNSYTLDWTNGTAKESNYELEERVGTLTVYGAPQPDPNPDPGPGPNPSPGPNPNPDPDRVIDGEFSRRKTYGDEPFALGLASRNPRDTDVWTYEVDYDDYAARGFEPAVSVDDKGIVTIHHAGSSIIKVTLSDEQGTYEKVVSYVYVTINPASLAVSSFASRGEEQVTSAAYGSLGQLSYGLSFNGLVYDDTPDTFTHGHGTLQAVPVDEASDASATPYTIDIAKLGVPLTVEGERNEDAFVSRDYLISYDKGSLTVTPAPLTVRTQSASKPYDGTPLTAEGSVEGLVNGQTVGFAVTGSQTEVGSSINTYALAWNGTAKESNYQVIEDLGILSVTGESPTSYRYLGDGDQSWAKGSDGKLVFVYKRSVEDETTYEHFTGIKVDGVAVARDLYEAHSGSVVISLLPTYLKGMSLGNHVLTACFDDGVAPDVNFTITETGGGTDDNGGGGTGGGGSTPAGGSTPSTPGARTPSVSLPETGDVTDGDGAWMMVLALAGLGLVVLSRLVSRMQER